MVTLQKSIVAWSAKLPETLVPLKRTDVSIKNPLFRCFDREVNLGAKTLATYVQLELSLLHNMLEVNQVVFSCSVRGDFSKLLAVLDQKQKPTNDVRTLLKFLSKDQVGLFFPRVDWATNPKLKFDC